MSWFEVQRGQYLVTTKRQVSPPPAGSGPQAASVIERIADPKGHVYRVCVGNKTNYGTCVLTDGYYFYPVYPDDKKLTVYDHLVAATIEVQFDQALRPPKPEVTWNISITRKAAKIIENVAVETLRLGWVEPAGGFKIGDARLFPKQILDILGAKRNGDISYANVTSLTQNISQVKWYSVGSNYLRGRIKLPEFRMSEDVLASFR